MRHLRSRKKAVILLARFSCFRWREQQRGLGLVRSEVRRLAREQTVGGSRAGKLTFYYFGLRVSAPTIAPAAGGYRGCFCSIPG